MSDRSIGKSTAFTGMKRTAPDSGLQYDFVPRKCPSLGNQSSSSHHDEIARGHVSTYGTNLSYPQDMTLDCFFSTGPANSLPGYTDQRDTGYTWPPDLEGFGVDDCEDSLLPLCQEPQLRHLPEDSSCWPDQGPATAVSADCADHVLTFEPYNDGHQFDPASQDNKGADEGLTAGSPPLLSSSGGFSLILVA